MDLVKTKSEKEPYYFDAFSKKLKNAIILISLCIRHLIVAWQHMVLAGTLGGAHGDG